MVAELPTREPKTADNALTIDGSIRVPFPPIRAKYRVWFAHCGSLRGFLDGRPFGASTLSFRSFRINPDSRCFLCHEYTCRDSAEVCMIQRESVQSSVAVGTALASGPPHRSVREGLPHTALTSGSCDGLPLVGIRMQYNRLRLSLLAACRTRHKPVTRIPGSVSGARCACGAFPLVAPFPLRTPLPTHTRRLCSPASLVL